MGCRLLPGHCQRLNNLFISPFSNIPAPFTPLPFSCCSISFKLFSSSTFSSSAFLDSMAVLRILVQEILCRRLISLNFSFPFMNSAMHLFSWGHVLLLDDFDFVGTDQFVFKQLLDPFVVLSLESDKLKEGSHLGTVIIALEESFLNNFIHLDKILFGLFIFFPFTVWSGRCSDRCCGWVTVFLKKSLKLDDHDVHHHLQLTHIREDGGVDQHPHGTLNLVVDMRFFLITLINFTISGFFDEDFSCIVAVVIDILYKITSDKLLLSFIIICVVE